MTEQKKSFSDWPTYLAKAAGGLVLLLGIAVMAGWFTDSPILVQLQPQWVPMHFNTALSFILYCTGWSAFSD